jgi:RNA polymerase sigma factor (sigma-70 family)
LRARPAPPPIAANAPEEVELLQALLGARTQVERDRIGAAFVLRYERLVRSCVLKVMRRYGAAFVTHDVDDLVADVWVMLFQNDCSKLRKYDATRGFRIASFIGMVSTHTAIDYLRSQRSNVPLDDEILRQQVAPTSSCDVEERQHAVLAQRAMELLSGEERTFICAVYCEERDPQELARALGVSTNTVYSRKFKLREKLTRTISALAA